MRAFAWLALAVSLWACGPKRPPEIENEATVEAPAPSPPRMTRVRAERPAVDLSAVLPDPSEDIRWPLNVSTHPVLEPHYAIASVLAQPGITWLDLCARGAQNRHIPGQGDQLEYLRAWCSVADHRAGDALAHLKPLVHSPVLGLAEVIPVDIANILADNGDAPHAERLLSDAGIRDVEVLDTLAATYVEVGHLDDAWEINRQALEHDANAGGADAFCERAAKNIVLSGPGMRPQLVDALEVALKNSHSATCVALVHELRCWATPGEGCKDYLTDHHLDLKYADLINAYYRWPRVPAEFDSWWTIAVLASAARPLQGSYAMWASALDSSIKTSWCYGSRLHDVNAMVTLLFADSDRPHELDALATQLHDRIYQLQALTQDNCRLELEKLATAP